jgi:hypothetical protein
MGQYVNQPSEVGKKTEKAIYEHNSSDIFGKEAALTQISQN